MIWLLILILASPVFGKTAGPIYTHAEREQKEFEHLYNGLEAVSSVTSGGISIKQFQYKLFANTGLSIMSGTDNNYHLTPTNLNFTSLSCSSTIYIQASGTGMVKAPLPESPNDIAIFRDSTNLSVSTNTSARPYRLLSPPLDFTFDPTYGMVDTQIPVTIFAVDYSSNTCVNGTPASVNYGVNIRASEGSPTPNYNARWCNSGGTDILSNMMIIEIE